MDRKKIYIIVITICLVGTAAVLYFGLRSPSGGGGVDLIPVSSNNNTNASSSTGSTSGALNNLPSLSGVVTHVTPRVFPVNSKLDLGIFNSSKFGSLKDYVPLTVSPEEVGRDNPYIPF
jgi:hypothetical protein